LRTAPLKDAEHRVRLPHGDEDPDIVAEIGPLGASGYLPKSSASVELFTAIER
jgi:hypothetical protein